MSAVSCPKPQRLTMMMSVTNWPARAPSMDRTCQKSTVASALGAKKTSGLGLDGKKTHTVCSLAQSVIQLEVQQLYVASGRQNSAQAVRYLLAGAPRTQLATFGGFTVDMP